MNTIPRRLWQVAGALVIAHCLLIPLCLALEQPALFGDGVGAMKGYAEGNLTQTFAGGILESFAFLLLVPVLAFWDLALGRGSVAAAWAARTATLCGLGYVAVTFAVGFPGGGAAMYGVQHGLGMQEAFGLNNLRFFGYVLSLMLLGGSTLGYAAAAMTSGQHRRWFGWFGLVAGVVLVASTPLAAVGMQDYGTLVWMVWAIGAGVLMLRHRQPVSVENLGTVPEPARIGHA